VGDYFNNTVIGAVEGIKMGRTLDYFNNLVVDVIDVGIAAPEDGAQVFNNTIVGSDNIGISAGGRGAIVIDNIIADAEDPIEARRALTARNLVGNADAIGFVSSDAYSLAADSPAVNAGNRCGWIPAVDSAGGTRPSGGRVDIGAFEHGAVASSPGARPPERLVYDCSLERPIRRASRYVV
jgi:hypothetical protein